MQPKMLVWIKDSINFEGEWFALYKCAYLNQFFVILFILIVGKIWSPKKMDKKIKIFCIIKSFRNNT